MLLDLEKNQSYHFSFLFSPFSVSRAVFPRLLPAVSGGFPRQQRPDAPGTADRIQGPQAHPDQAGELGEEDNSGYSATLNQKIGLLAPECP